MDGRDSTSLEELAAGKENGPMKYALITGASRGIGAAAAREFARRGWGVAELSEQPGPGRDAGSGAVRDGCPGSGSAGGCGGPETGPGNG